jgi:hypothetical protein
MILLVRTGTINSVAGLRRYHKRRDPNMGRQSEEESAHNLTNPFQQLKSAPELE